MFVRLYYAVTSYARFDIPIALQRTDGASNPVAQFVINC